LRRETLDVGILEYASCPHPICCEPLYVEAFCFGGPHHGASLSQDPNYWEHRYETQSCSFDWFYGFTACRALLRTLINRKKVVLQIGCGNSTLQEGMANDGYTIVNVSYTVGERSAKLGVALESPLCFMHVDGHIFHRDTADGGEAQTHPQPDLYGL
jgi:hypothetical protein